MFFLLRCAFWLAVVAMATPGLLSQEDKEHLVSRAGNVMQVAAAVAPSVLASPPAAQGCVMQPSQCINEFANEATVQSESGGLADSFPTPVKIDLIGLTLERGVARGTMTRVMTQHQGLSDEPTRRTASRARSTVDPIAAELQRVARRD